MTEMLRYRMKMFWHYCWFLVFLLAFFGPGIPVFLGLMTSGTDQAVLGVLSGVLGSVCFGLGIIELDEGRPVHPSKKEVLPPSTYALDKLIADPTARMLDIVREAEARGVTQFKEEHPGFKTTEELAQEERVRLAKLEKYKAEMEAKKKLEQERDQMRKDYRDQYLDDYRPLTSLAPIMREHNWIDISGWIDSDRTYACTRCGLRSAYMSNAFCEF